MPVPLIIGGVSPPPPPPPPTPGGRFYHIVQAAFGTAPPAEPNTTVTLPGVLNVGGWTTLTGPDAAFIIRNGVAEIRVPRVSKNRANNEPEPGLADIILDADNGWLDPENPTGPYYRYLTSGCQLRVLRSNGTTSWDVGRVFVARWPASESVKPGQKGHISAYCPLGWLGGTPAPYPTDLHRAIMETQPSSYWPHADPSGQILVTDVVSGIDGWINGPAALGGPSMTPEGYGGSATFSNQPEAFVQTSPQAIPRPPFTIAMMVRIFQVQPTPAGLSADFFSTGIISGTAAGVYMSPQWAAVWDGVSPVARFTTWVSGGTVLPTGAYMLAMTYKLSGELTCWLGAGPSTIGRTTFGTFQTPPAYTAPRWGAAIGIPSPGDTGNGNQISHVAVWPRALDGGEMSALLGAAFVARAGETVDQRVNYLLDQARWPAAKRQIGLCSSTVGPVRMASESILTLVKRAVAYEDGTLAAQANGNISLTGRNGDPAPSAVQLGGAAAMKESASYATDDMQAVTTAEVSDPPVLFTDTGGLIAGRSVKLDQLASSGDQAWLTAQRIVQLGGVAKGSNVDTVTFDPVTTPEVLNVELGQIRPVARRPRWSATDIVENYQVGGILDTGLAAGRALRTVSLVRARRIQRYLRMPAGGTGAASAPWQASFDTASVNVLVQFRLDNWTDGLVHQLAAHTNGANGWAFGYSANVSPPVLTFAWYDNAAVAHVANSLPVARIGRRFMWASATLNPVDGSVLFAISSGSRYRTYPWGQTVFGATTIKATLSAPLEMGVSAGSTNPLAGDMLQGLVYTQPGVAVAAFDPTRDSPTGALSWTSPLGETWTVSGSGSLVAG